MNEEQCAPLTTPYLGTMPQPVSPVVDVIIRKAENGWQVQLGCKTFVAMDWDYLQKGLKEYYDNPQEAQKKWCKP